MSIKTFPGIMMGVSRFICTFFPPGISKRNGAETSRPFLTQVQILFASDSPASVHLSLCCVFPCIYKPLVSTLGFLSGTSSQPCCTLSSQGLSEILVPQQHLQMGLDWVWAFRVVFFFFFSVKPALGNPGKE